MLLSKDTLIVGAIALLMLSVVVLIWVISIYLIEKGLGLGM